MNPTLFYPQTAIYYHRKVMLIMTLMVMLMEMAIVMITMTVTLTTTTRQEQCLRQQQHRNILLKKIYIKKNTLKKY